MKTKPAKLLMTLLLGLGSVAFATASAYAGDSKDSKDGEGHGSASAPKCTGKVVSDCGVKFVLTTCTGSAVSASSKDKDGRDEADDKDHESKAKNSNNKNDRDRAEESHRDHADRSGDAKEGKIAICHRMGGAAVSLVVANDGWLSDHSKHALDTVGRCEDFDAIKKDDDSKEDKDRDHKVSASDVGYSIGLTTTQVACLNKYNTGNSTISIQAAGQGPSRGGARTLH